MPASRVSLDSPTDKQKSMDDANPTLNRIRNMWQFANLCQWIYIFGRAVKIDDAIDIEEIENQCLKTDSPLLTDIAVALLRIISNHRGLTVEGVDSQAQKQYIAHAPHLNPFGTDEIANRFQDLDVFTKITVLQQFTQWTMIYPDRLRDKMEEQRDTEQSTWRIEPYGWDGEDRTYFVLDDNRVYRQAEVSQPTPGPARKKNTQRTGRRGNKRRRTDRGAKEILTSTDESSDFIASQDAQEGLGGMSWECIAISLDQVRDLLKEFRNTRDANEATLRRQLELHLVPILEKQEESRKRRALQRDRDLANLAKMANAKRSSRIASKVEQQKNEEKVKEEKLHLKMAEEARVKGENERHRQEHAREVRLASREARLKDREARRSQYEARLAYLSAEDDKRTDKSGGRISERQMLAEIEKNRQALEALGDDEDWVFDCTCGLYGQVDDGTHSVACETCNVWQHSKCLGIREEEAERPDFHFICKSCRRPTDKVEAHPKPLIKLKVSKLTSPGSPNLAPKPTSASESTTSDTDTGPRHNKEDKGPTSAIAQCQPSQDTRAGVVLEQKPLSMLSQGRGGLVDQRGPLENDVGNNEPRLAGSASAASTPSQLQQHIASGKEWPSRQKTHSPSPAPSQDPVLLTGLVGSRSDISSGASHGIENGPPSHAGLSPIKLPVHTAVTPTESREMNITSNGGIAVSPQTHPKVTALSSEVTLAPSSQQPILTPPTKQSYTVHGPR